MTHSITTVLLFLASLGFGPDDAKKAQLAVNWHDEPLEIMITRTDAARVDQAQVLGIFPHAKLSYFKENPPVMGEKTGPGLLSLDPRSNAVLKVFYQAVEGGIRWTVPNKDFAAFLMRHKINVQKNFSLLGHEGTESEVVLKSPEMAKTPHEGVRSYFMLLREPEKVGATEAETTYRIPTPASSYIVDFAEDGKLTPLIAERLLGMSPDDRALLAKSFGSYVEKVMEERLNYDEKTHGREWENKDVDRKMARAWWYGEKAYVRHFNTYPISVSATFEGHTARGEKLGLFDLLATVHQGQKTGLVVVPVMHEWKNDASGQLLLDTPENARGSLKFSTVKIFDLALTGEKSKQLKEFKVLAPPFIDEYIEKTLNQQLTNPVDLHVYFNEGKRKKIANTITEWESEQWLLYVKGGESMNKFFVEDQNADVWSVELSTLGNRRPARSKTEYPVKYVRNGLDANKK